MRSGSGWRVPPSASPAPRLSLGLVAAATAGAPPPVTAGRSGAAPAGPRPLLRWEVLDGDTFLVPAELIRDGTGALRSGGIVELGCPAGGSRAARRARRACPNCAGCGPRLTHGEFATPPVLTEVRLNVARARGPDDPERGAASRLQDARRTAGPGCG